MSSPRLYKVVFTIITIIFPLTLSAAINDLTVSGFASIGGSHVSGNNFLGNEEKKHELVNLGLNANYVLPANLTVKGQIAYRRAGELLNDNSLQLDYAFIDWSNNSLGFGEQIVALGRVKAPAGLYNINRDSPSSRPNIFLAQSIYLDIFRNLNLKVDGLKLRSVHDIGEGIFSIEAVYGTRYLDNNFGQNAFTLERYNAGQSGDWESKGTKIVDLKYSTFDTTLGFTYTVINTEFMAGQNQTLQLIGDTLFTVANGDVNSNIFIFSFQTHLQGFELTSEYSRRNYKLSGILPNFPLKKRPSEGYYVQIRYGFDNAVTLMARYDTLYRNADDKNGKEAQRLGLPAWAEKAVDYTFALNWVVNKNVSLNSEVHFVEGSAWLPPFAILQPEAFEKRHWTLFSTELVYKF